MDCPRCRQKILADDADLEILVAKCAKCQNVFGFDQVATDTPLPPNWASNCPSNIRIEENENGNHLVYRWRGMYSVLFVEFAVVWNLVASVLVAVLLPDIEHWMQALVLFFFPAVGAWLAYSSIANLINTTMVSVTASTLTVLKGPLPWPGNVALPSENIRRLHCVADVDEPGVNMLAWVSVRAVLYDGKERVLIGLPLETALFVGRQLEHWLNLAARGSNDGLPTLRQTDP